MPLQGSTIFALLNDVPVGRHVIDRRATVVPRVNPYDIQVSAACENWAIRALQGNAIDPPSLFDDIRTSGGELGPVANTPHANAGLAIKTLIRNTFGYQGNMTTYAVPLVEDDYGSQAETIAHRNARRAALHGQTARVFELCLTFNGFTISNNPTDYMVCMEYECARTQPMYPNFTHAWLMFRKKRIIQTVTGAYISASRHHAGRQPHCGFIRRYVTDFHANQIAVIAGIMSNQTLTNFGVTGCDNRPEADIGIVDWPTDEQSPNE